jgi:broad specificity phosphatase PhoE
VPATDDSTIVLVRHIPTKLNAAGVSRSWMRVGPDPEELEKQTPGIAKVLQGLGVAKLRSSDLPRASKTADAIGKEMGIDNEPTFDLRTWETGQGGKKDSETLPIRQKYMKYPEEKPPGGEPFDDFMNRSRSEFGKAQKYNAQNPDKPMALVVHGHQMMSAESLINGEPVDPKNLNTFEKDYPPGSVSLLHVRGGKAELERIHPATNKKEQ